MSQPERTEKEILIDLSCWAGSRFDWVQAAGGNTSIKTVSGEMLVKASGVHLSDIGGAQGMVSVDYRALWDTVQKSALNPSWETRAEEKRMLEESVLDTVFVRPSIETFMHACLGKVVLHIHPLMLNILTSQHGWDTKLAPILPEAILVPYTTPGLPLAVAIATRVAGREAEPLVIILQNHGLVVSGPSVAWVQQTTREISDVMSAVTGFQDDSDVQDLWSTIQAIQPSMVWAARDHHVVTALQQDEIWDCPSFLPDLVVFGADHVLRVSADMAELRTYWEMYGILPKVIVFQARVIFLAPILNQARQMEDVLSSKVMLLKHIPLNEISLLDRSEVHHLLGWDAEDYRQKMGVR
jgi:rhamnose utilization protein RhaD (predicted bifunctional aldolase and dehydrogenase)